MKPEKITGIALFLFVCLCCFFSCSDDDKRSDTEIDVSVCGQKNPAWLQHEVNAVAKKPEEHTEINIYSFSLESREYVALHTQRIYSSKYPDYIQFYLCSGEEISSETKEWEFLLKAFMLDEFRLIWSFESR